MEIKIKRGFRPSNLITELGFSDALPTIVKIASLQAKRRFISSAKKFSRNSVSMKIADLNLFPFFST